MTSAAPVIHATTAQLLKASGGALLLASAILLTTVLPAEYGLDPTGIGQALGLTALSEPAAAAPPVTAAAVAPPASLVVQRDTAFKSGELSLTLAANQGAEIKALMAAGDGFVFSWRSDGGPVNFDMHGEKPNAGDEFTSYWKDRGKTSGHGSFTAPFAGSHGWYWKNKGAAPVTVTVTVSGWFERLYMP
ncbi:hypothetical protein [Nevskia sp.]|uniref:hypothetical protein n=1 Tax=Nevskia sp. TaxID=1929292 RepID=UPI0025DF96A0|nr:hypothetical protein [Nevskia sp.]